MGISVDEYKKLLCNKSKNSRRQLQGMKNHESGKNFEDTILEICEYYKNNNIAIIEKTPEPMRVLSHNENGHFDAIFMTSAQPDFKGTIFGGRTIVFDAKYTETDRIRYQALSDYQRDTLIKYKEFGAMSFILVGFNNGLVYKIDIEIWEKMKEIYGRKYITQDELEIEGYRVKNKNGIIDLISEGME